MRLLPLLVLVLLVSLIIINLSEARKKKKAIKVRPAVKRKPAARARPVRVKTGAKPKKIKKPKKITNEPKYVIPDGVTEYQDIPLYKSGKPTTVSVRTASLRAHDVLRKIHGINTPLRWNTKLAEMAQKWANQIASDGKLSHSDKTQRLLNGKAVGENVGYRGSQLKDTVYPPQFTIYSWYKENNDGWFNFNNPESLTNKKAYHFSQIVWLKSTQLGCAASTRKVEKMYDTFLVCNYFPAGNIRGSFEANVKKNIKPLCTDPEELAEQQCADSTDQCSLSKKYGWCKHHFILEICCDTCNN